MAKIKQYVNIYDISSEPTIVFYSDIYQFNIASIVNSVNVNRNKLDKLFRLVKLRTNKLYIRGLAALCGKLCIPYGESSCISIISSVIEVANKHDLKLVESEIIDIRNCGLRPFSHLYYMFDNTLFINKILSLKFNVLGYTNSQLLELYNLNNDLLSFLTSDLLNELPILNNMNKIQYNKIKEYFV